MRRLSAFLVAVTLAGASVAGQSGAGVDTRSANAFLETLRTAVDHHDPQAVARLVQYPLTFLSSPFQIPVPDAATFIRLYDTFFTPEARCAIVQSGTSGSGNAPRSVKDAPQITADGISIGSGLLWAAHSGTGFNITRMTARGKPAPPSRLPKRRVTFLQGFQSTQLLGALDRDDIDTFLVAARQGQVLGATITGFRGQDLGMRVLDSHGTEVETRLHIGPRTWSGAAPATAEYRIEIARLAPYCNPTTRYEITFSLH
jgi:hypothetical protein